MYCVKKLAGRRVQNLKKRSCFYMYLKALSKSTPFSLKVKKMIYENTFNTVF